jgi:hypothetical protein
MHGGVIVISSAGNSYSAITITGNGVKANRVINMDGNHHDKGGGRHGYGREGLHRIGALQSEILGRNIAGSMTDGNLNVNETLGYIMGTTEPEFQILSRCVDLNGGVSPTGRILGVSSGTGEDGFSDFEHNRLGRVPPLKKRVFALLTLLLFFTTKEREDKIDRKLFLLKEIVKVRQKR